MLIDPHRHFELIKMMMLIQSVRISVYVSARLEEVKDFYNGLEENLTMLYENTLSLKVNTKIFQVSVLMLSSPYCL